MTRYEVRDFAPGDIDEAARLSAERHRHHRQSMMALDRRFEDPAATRPEIAALLEREDASGAIVLSHGRAMAFVLGTRRSDATWGPNVWIDASGSGGTDVEAIREVYAHAAGRWFDEGRTNHHVVVPATDRKVNEAWASLDFGRQHVHALREPVWREFVPTLAEGLIVRLATRDDIPALAELDLVLPRHSAGTAVFSRLPIPTLGDATAELDADFGDPRYTVFVGEHEGRVVGTAIACSLELSPIHTPLMRPRSAGFLGFAAVLPDARGLGAGRALGETVIAWARDEGHEWVATDWRSTNLEANRAWLALGFRPTFYRLHRSIG